MTHRDRLDDQNDRATDYQYGATHGARYLEHIDHQVRLLLHALLPQLLFGEQSRLAKRLRIQLRYLLVKFRDAEVRNQP